MQIWRAKGFLKKDGRLVRYGLFCYIGFLAWIFLLFFHLANLAIPAFAFELADQPAPNMEMQNLDLSAEQAKAEDLSQQIKLIGVEIEQDKAALNLDNLHDKLLNYIKQSLDRALALRPALLDINVQLNSAPDSPNSAAGSKMGDKAKASQLKEQINAIMANLEASYIAGHYLLDKLSLKSQNLFTKSLTEQVPVWDAFRADLPAQFSAKLGQFYQLIANWLSSMFEQHLWHFLSALLLPIIVAYYVDNLLYAMLRRFTKHAHKQLQDFAEGSPYESRQQETKQQETKQAEAKQSFAQIAPNNNSVPKQNTPRFTIAFLSIFMPLFPWGLFFIASYQMMELFGLLPQSIAILARHSAIEIFLLLFFYRFAKAVFAPPFATLQLIPLDLSSGKILVILISLLAAIIGLDKILTTIFTIVAASNALLIAKNLITVLLASLVIFAIIISYPQKRLLKEKAFGAVAYWKLSLILLASLAVLLSLLGYVGLAHYVTQQIVIVGVLLLFLYLGFLTARHIAQPGAFAQSSLGRMVSKYWQLSPNILNQLGLFVGFIIDLLVLLISIPAIFTQLGFSAKLIYEKLINILTGFEIGNIAISPIAIFWGLVVFFLSLFLLRRFIAWLDEIVLERSKIDSGLRNSIKTMLSYGAFALAVIIGLSIAGVNLSSFALIAGGLSLGIGFGLQNIVQNFVAGLIILVERPFKAGDYIEAGTANGIVKNIKVRATEIETLKKEIIIIPNSSFINSNVSNWTKRNLTGRLDIPITIPAKEDPERIYELLEHEVKSISEILKKPAPYIAFTSFDKANFTFTISVYLPNILKPLPLANKIKYKIYRRLASEGWLE